VIDAIASLVGVSDIDPAEFPGHTIMRGGAWLNASVA
jgi:hypothetical protein